MFEWLKRLFLPSSQPPKGFTINIKCKRCGEVIPVRIRAVEESNPEFGPSDEIVRYELWKDVLGEKCPNLMRLHITFSPDWRIISKEVENGEIVEDSK
ncbi:MAG: hypothetical protein CBR30_06430 [Dictyoglomus sp. NZ13-RE01]|nr:MAG: hypothetical protein CBR30_06430 [Dictyoglomus sp. NZ13-RE01]